MRNRLKVRWESALCSLGFIGDKVKTWQAGGGRADHQMGTTSVLHLASPPGYLYFHYGFTTCSFLSSPIRNFDLRNPLPCSEGFWNTQISEEHTNANIWRNKLGLKCFHEWELYYKIHLEKVKRNTGNWQGFWGFAVFFACLVGFGFDFFNGRKLYD